ncbi:hypothetical protein [Flavicella sp.]|uniref:hypothetical protein n=1 Tax=Flavicella sp. TaxID=2957742 RepID=UPI00301901CD
MRKNIFIIFTFLLICVTNTNGQNKMNFEKIKTLKVNYISSELNLSSEVAEKFWPIYNQYEKTNHSLRSTKIKSIKAEIDKKGSIDNLSDEKSLELSNKFQEVTASYVKNREDTFKKLEKILTPQQLLKLNFVEIEFNHKVLRKYRNKDPK